MYIYKPQNFGNGISLSNLTITLPKFLPKNTFYNPIVTFSNPFMNSSLCLHININYY